MKINEKIKNIPKAIKKFDLKKHLVDTTAINAFAVPTCAAMETSTKICDLISKIPYVDVSAVTADVSLKTRAYAVGLGYLGLAFLLSKGRNSSRKLFKIKETSKESLQWSHDTAYLIGFNAIINPALYYISGSRDLKEMIGGTLALTVFSAFAGGPIGYTIDVFSDLTGLESCERKLYPNFIKKKSQKFKKGLAALLVTGSIAATIGVYDLKMDKSAQPLENISPPSISKPSEPPHKDITSFINR